MAETFSCGFARVAVKTAKDKSGKLQRDKSENATKYKIRCIDKHYEEFTNRFSGLRNFSITREKFVIKAPKIVDAFSNWNSRRYNERKVYLETFSETKWNCLSDSEKTEHSASDCVSCHIKYRNVQNLFPVKYRRLKDASSTLNIAATNIQDNISAYSSSTEKGKRSAAIIKKDTKAIFTKVNENFQVKYGLFFSEAIHKTPAINLQLKISPQEKKAAAREIARKHKRKVEEVWKENDTNVFLACRQTFSQRQKTRLALSFETTEAASQRVEKRKRLEEEGLRKKKRHARRWQDVEFDKQKLLQEARQLFPGSKVCNTFLIDLVFKLN